MDNTGLLTVASGTLDFPGCHLDNMTAGAIGGTGTFDVSTAASFTNSGRTSPGLSPGTLTFNFNYACAASSTLEIEIAGSVAGNEYDQLAVNGTAALAGGLTVGMLDGFLPETYDEFSVITHNGHSGSFAVGEIAINDSLYFEIDYRPTEVVLIARKIAVPVLHIDYAGEVLMLSWNPIGEAVYYNIYSGTPYGPHTLPGTTTETEYDITSLLPSGLGSFHVTTEMPEAAAGDRGRGDSAID